jgi:hypothetical protein
MNELATHEQVRDEYLEHVAALYSRVREWLRGFAPDAQIETERITLREEPIEPYPAEILVINRPHYKTVRLIPRGRWIIGAEGRVDMKSDLGTETLVYVTDGGPAIKFETLTENGKVLDRGEHRLAPEDVAEGWVFLQNRQMGMLPVVDADLFYRLLEVLGR